MNSTTQFAREFKVPLTRSCPFVQIVSSINANTSNLGLLLVTRNGTIRYWADFNNDHFIEYDANANITALENINVN